MKVVLFCGGLGTRLREYSETIPKPLATIGSRPILWHFMKYYAFCGHTEFILCLGYRGDLLKEYFLKYDECLSNDFVLKNGAKEVHLYASDITDWQITFAETGINSNLGQRLRAVKKYLGSDEMFMVNYSDGLSDLPLTEHIDKFSRTNAFATFVSVRTAQSFHTVSIGSDGFVDNIGPMHHADIWINGGFFIFRREIFDYIENGEELVEEPFERLIRERRLMTYKYEGFWSAMDTYKDKKMLDDLYAKDDTPWEVWKREAPDGGETTPSREAHQRVVTVGGSR